MALIWESSSFGANPVTGSLPIIAKAYWSASLGPFSSSITDASQLTSSYGVIGDKFSSLTSSVVSEDMMVVWPRDTTALPGILYGFEEAEEFGLEVQFTEITYTYAQLSSSLDRQGLFVNQSTGSPQISLEAVAQDPDEIWAGDFWYLSTGSYDGENGYRIADENKSDNSIFISRPLLSRIAETDYSDVVLRYSTVDGPSNINVGVTSIVASNWFVTVNSASILGSGWVNDTWDGGIYMPDSNSVGVYGNKDFRIPSGNLIVSGTVSAPRYIGIIDTASYALTSAGTVTNAISSSYAATASLLLGSIVSASYALTASYASNGGGSGISSSYATTSSYAALAQNVLGSIVSASYASTSSIAYEIGVIDAGIINTGSQPYVLPQFSNILSASYAGTASLLLGSIVSASYGLTASYATLAQNVLGSITSASYALTASYAVNGGSGGSLNYSTGSYTGSFTGSFKGDGSAIINIVSASYATTASYVPTPVHAFGSSTGAKTFDYSQYQTATLTLTGNVTLTVTNLLPSGNATVVNIIETGDGSHTITYAGLTVTFPSGTPPVLASGTMRYVQLVSTDGSTALGFYSGVLTTLESINTQTSNYTLVLTDSSKIIEMNVGSSNNLTIPLNSSVAFSTGTLITICQLGAGTTTVVATSGVTIRTAKTLVLNNQYSVATLYKRGTDEWVLSGDLT